MALQGSDQTSRGRVPQLDRAVSTRGCEAASIRTKCHTENAVAVASKRPGWFGLGRRLGTARVLGEAGRIEQERQSQPDCRQKAAPAADLERHDSSSLPDD